MNNMHAKEKSPNNLQLKKFLTYLKNIVLSKSNHSAIRKLQSSLWAILVAIILASIIITINGYNSTEIYGGIARNSFNILLSENLRLYLVYMVAGIAVALSFKSGFFNIGIPGQMTTGGGLGLLYLFQTVRAGETFSMSHLFVALLISIVMGSVFAIIAGLLRAYLKVHEVVSTILLNWIAYYIFRFIFARPQSPFLNPTSQPPGSQNLSSFINDNSNQALTFLRDDVLVYILLAFVILLLVVVFFVLTRTTFGYKLRMVGLNKDASAYSGNNEKHLIVIVFALSGALAGFAGWLLFVVRNLGAISFSSAGPVSFGFDAISVALIAFNSPLGIIASSLLYSSFTTGLNNLDILNSEFLPLANEFSFIFVGLIIVLIAASVIFLNFKPLSWLKTRFLIAFYCHYYHHLFKKHNFNLAQKNGKYDKHALFEKEVTFKNDNLLKINETDYGALKKAYLRIKLHWIFYHLHMQDARALYRQNRAAYKKLKKSLKTFFDKINAMPSPSEEKIPLMNRFMKKPSQEIPLSTKEEKVSSKKLEELLKLSKMRIKVNEELAKLGYFEKENLRNEFRSFISTERALLKNLRSKVHLEHNRLWKDYFLSLNSFKDFKKFKVIFKKMRHYSKTEIKGDI